MSERKPLSKSARFKVFSRDLFTCQYCGRKPPEVVLEVDHVLAVSKGGGNGEHNLLTSCAECNRGKAAGDVLVPPINLDDRMSIIKERSAQVRAYEKLLAKEREEIDGAIDRVIAVFESHFDGWTIDAGRPSIRKFLAKLPPSQVMDAMEMACCRVAMAHAFKYFCGICWRWIKEGRQ